MTDVGVREFKRDLSAYLKRAAGGEEIRVTMRGSPVVRLQAITAADPVDPHEAQWEALFASGRATPPSRPKRRIEATDLGLTHDPVALILQERGVQR